MDDVVVVIAPGQAEAAHKVVVDSLARHGLTINARKTCVWSREPAAVLLPAFL